MIYNFQSQVISNPIEQAQLKLKIHNEKGTASNLSIFEVANLMDTVVFSKIQSENKTNSTFSICIN